MFKYLYSLEVISNKLRRYASLLHIILLVSFAGVSHSAEQGDEDVIAFFRNLENSFLERDFSPIVKNLHKDFSYIMTYSTDDNISFLESDVKDYRKNVGSFFLSKPNIHEYSIKVEDIQYFGEDIMVLIRIKSVVELYNIINSCDASSNYHLQYIDNHLVVRDIRGDATCFNTKMN